MRGTTKPFQIAIPGPISRRRAILVLAAGALAAACAPEESESGVAPAYPLPDQVPGGEVGDRGRHADSVDALCDRLLPAEYGADGALVAPGAREAGVEGVLRIEDFAALATAQGLLAPLPDNVVERLSGLGDALRAAVNGELDGLAARHRPLTRFRDLSPEEQERVIDEAFEDPAHRPAMLLVRAACFLAFLGATTNDLGLRAVGFPPFESFADGVAVSGYPRTRSGRLVDAAKENLRALQASGDLDDYTYNREPAPTPGDDLSLILDERGDLR